MEIGWRFLGEGVEPVPAVPEEDAVHGGAQLQRLHLGPALLLRLGLQQVVLVGVGGQRAGRLGRCLVVGN